MNIADNLYDAGIRVPDELDRKFDSALAGYLVRYDMPHGLPAYDHDRFQLLARSIPVKDTCILDQVRFVHPLPTHREFGQMIDGGALVWEALNTAVVGKAGSIFCGEGPLCLVYSYEKALHVLDTTFVDSTSTDIREAVRLYFESEIMLADLGPLSPYVLKGGDPSPAAANGLGFKSVLPLPTGRRGLSAYIDKTRPHVPTVPLGDSDAQAHPAPAPAPQA